MTRPLPWPGCQSGRTAAWRSRRPPWFAQRTESRAFFCAATACSTRLLARSQLRLRLPSAYEVARSLTRPARAWLCVEDQINCALLRVCIALEGIRRQIEHERDQVRPEPLLPSSSMRRASRRSASLQGRCPFSVLPQGARHHWCRALRSFLRLRSSQLRQPIPAHW